MRARAKLAILLAGLALSLGFVSATAFAVWRSLDQGERAMVGAVLAERAGILAFAVLLLLVVLWTIADLVVRQYVSAPLEIAEGTRLIATSNPSHRVEPKGSAGLREVAGAINALAEQNEDFRLDVKGRIAEAQAKLAEEKNRLGALLSELAQSVLVCNADGQILLYNDHARRLLEEPSAESGVAAANPVGLGRSVFAILERNLIGHALESIQARLRKGEASPVASFVTTTTAGRLVRVRVAPVRGAAAEATERANGGEDAIAGVVLIMDDVTAVVESRSRTEVVLRSLIEANRRALGNIRAAAETLHTYRDMGPEKEARFIEVISQEATSMSATLERTVAGDGATLGAEWLFDDMLAADLLAAARSRVEATLGMRVDLEVPDADLWLNVDSYSVITAIETIGRRLRDECGARELRLRLQAAGRFAQIDLAWVGLAVATDTLARWEAQPLAAHGSANAVTLKQVVERHGGEIWHQLERGSAGGFFRLLLPATRRDRAAFRSSIARPGRPEYYDFDLFHQAGQTAELDQRSLAELTYSVFDTETTGLDPSAGDEIVCIGALRIVNGRLLHHEAFEQFIDPKRPVSLETVRVTGIDPSILKGQPTIDRVLPLFHRFCADSVLVGHNAAFDMRFLQLKEERAGVRFTQPVLDTLLLASVVQPNLGSNTLEALAERFGVAMVGRHTALGDAIMTGEIFLKLLPLLAERGIVTLKDAREASERSFYARVKY